MLHVIEGTPYVSAPKLYLLFLFWTPAAQNITTFEILGKKKKGLIEILLGTWICPYNAGEHSFFLLLLFIFMFSVMHPKMKDEIFILLFVLHCSCILHWRYCYSDIKVTEKFRSFFTFKTSLSFLRLYIQDFYLFITFE